MQRLATTLLMLALGGIALAADIPDVVRCKMPDGNLYFGAAPPENCKPLGRGRITPAPSAEDRARRGEDANPKDHRETPNGSLADPEPPY